MFLATIFQSFPKKVFIILVLSFLLFMGSTGGWVISIYEKNKKLTPLYEDIKNRETRLSSVEYFRRFKEDIAPLSLTAATRSLSYASSWDIEKEKLGAFLEATAHQFLISDLTYQIGPSSHTSQIPIEIHASIQSPLSLFHFINALYQGPYFLYGTHLSLHTKDSSLFEAVLTLEWFFPEQRTTKALYDFLLGLDAPLLENFFSFEEELSSLSSLFEKKEALSFSKENGASSPALTGILYTNSQKWTIWIDGVSITPHDNPTLYTILSVTPHIVHLETPKGPLFLSLQKKELEV